jgi:hypothetical protein
LPLLKSPISFGILLFSFSRVLPSPGEIRVVVERHDVEDFDPGFRFQSIPPPSVNDRATAATFNLVAGQVDRNSGSLEKLHDGQAPSQPDQPSENFFFNAGTDGGRLALDLGTAAVIKEVNTYSIHPGARAPQVFKLYASNGDQGDFDSRPGNDVDPATCGWTLLASVDTRPKEGDPGGQYGVSISDSDGVLGSYRHLLFVISRTENTDPFGNTFFSEIDIVDATTSPVVIATATGPTPRRIRREIEAAGGKYQLTIDTTASPDLTGWTDDVLAPVVKAWYPKIVALLPGDGFTAPARVWIVLRPGIHVPAYTDGNRITCDADWLRQNLRGEAAGSVVHEMVHVVQQYRRSRGEERVPGWLVEGIPDYIRWFLYEPESKGAEITAQNIDQSHYDGSYRITANFLNWVVETHDKDIVRKLNAAAREGRYREQLWKDFTGKTVQELGAEWKTAAAKRMAAPTRTVPGQ